MFFVLLPAVGSEVHQPAQLLWISADAFKEINHIPVQIVDRLDIGPGPSEQHRPATEERFQIAVVLGEVADDPMGQRPLCPRVFDNSVHSIPSHVQRPCFPLAGIGSTGLMSENSQA